MTEKNKSVKPKKTRAKREKNDYIDKEKLTQEIINLQISKKLEDNIALKARLADGSELIDLLEKAKKLEGKKLKVVNLKIEGIQSGQTLKDLTEEYPKLIEQGAVLNYSKQEFGKMVLLIINNLMKKHCFSGYTENWTEDFKSNAIYKIFRYIHNFDSERISEVTGKKVSSFAYLTQITYMAFLEVINKRKKENELMFKTMIPLQDVKIDYFTQDKGVNVSAMAQIEKQDEVEKIDVSEEELGSRTLFEYLEGIRKISECVEVYYPEFYSSEGNKEGVFSISIDEYNDIIGLDFKILRLKKTVVVEQEYDDTEEETACFLVQDEFVESWEWEED